jgi:hypothetical protein
MTETGSRLSDPIYGLAQLSDSWVDSRELTPAVTEGVQHAAIAAGPVCALVLL